MQNSSNSTTTPHGKPRPQSQKSIPSVADKLPGRPPGVRNPNAIHKQGQAMVFKTLLQESCIRKSEFALSHSSSRRRRRHATCSVGPGTFNCKLHVLNLLLRPTKDKTTDTQRRMESVTVKQSRNLRAIWPFRDWKDRGKRARMTASL